MVVRVSIVCLLSVTAAMTVKYVVYYLSVTIANFLGSWAQKALSLCCKHFYREYGSADDPDHHSYGQSNVLVRLLYKQPSNPDNIPPQTACSSV